MISQFVCPQPQSVNLICALAAASRFRRNNEPPTPNPWSWWTIESAQMSQCSHHPSSKVIYLFDCSILTTYSVSRTPLAVSIISHRLSDTIYLQPHTPINRRHLTAMPHPQLPHRSSSTDVADGFGNFIPTKDPFCTQVPLHSRRPSSSVAPRPSVISTTMTTAYPECVSSEEPGHPSSLMGLNDTTAFQWAAHCDLPVSRPSQEADYHVPPQYAPESSGLFDYPQNRFPYAENYNMTYAPHNLGASCPRSYTSGLDLTGLSSNMSMSESYPPSAYQIEPPKPQDVMDFSDQGISGQLLQLSDDYEHQYATNIKVKDHCGCDSPYSTNTTRCSTPHDDSPMTPHDLKNEYGEEDPIDKEQPYAQLIYRALLEAPGKTMILRDIYSWFKEHTDKAADKETKGWQNSIRHNLSMNGVCKPTPMHRPSC